MYTNDAAGEVIVERQLYVAQCTTSKRYLVNIVNWLWGERMWMESANPTDDEVREQVKLLGERRPIWTEVLNDADVWSKYPIDHFGKFLPEVEFVKVNLC